MGNTDGERKDLRFKCHFCGQKKDWVAVSNGKLGGTWAYMTGRLKIWIADAHRDDGKRFVVHADEKLTAFIELESAIRAE